MSLLERDLVTMQAVQQHPLQIFATGPNTYLHTNEQMLISDFVSCAKDFQDWGTALRREVQQKVLKTPEYLQAYSNASLFGCLAEEGWQSFFLSLLPESTFYSLLQQSLLMAIRLKYFLMKPKVKLNLLSLLSKLIQMGQLTQPAIFSELVVNLTMSASLLPTL